MSYCCLLSFESWKTLQVVHIPVEHAVASLHYWQDAAKRQTAGIKFTHRPKPLHRFTSNLAGPTGTWVRLAVQNFTSITTGGWECGPKNVKNFHFFRLDALALSVIATATWLAGWLAGCVAVCHSRYCIKTTKPIRKLFEPSGRRII